MILCSDWSNTMCAGPECTRMFWNTSPGSETSWRERSQGLSQVNQAPFCQCCQIPASLHCHSYNKNHGHLGTFHGHKIFFITATSFTAIFLASFPPTFIAFPHKFCGCWRFCCWVCAFSCWWCPLLSWRSCCCWDPCCCLLSSCRWGTPTKRQVSKRPISKRLKHQAYKTSGLQNVRFTKCQVYKTSGLQNVRLQKTFIYILYL